MLTSVRISMPTLSCLEAPPCTLVLLTVCRRKSPPLLLPPSRSRSSLLQRGSTLSGSEDPSLPLSPPSRLCGSPSRNMMNLVPLLSTGSASKFSKTECYLECGKETHLDNCQHIHWIVNLYFFNI